MSKPDVKCKQSYVDYHRDRSKIICRILGTGHSSDECTVLNDFSFRHTKFIPTKEISQKPLIKEKYRNLQENNAMFQHAVDDITPQEKKTKCEIWNTWEHWSWNVCWWAVRYWQNDPRWKEIM